jgi:uncharacterized protein (TIGR03000 family)
MLRTLSFCAASAALLATALPASAWGWNDGTYNGGFGPGPFPASYYGFHFDDYAPGLYYGGSRYKEFYGLGGYRGFGVASMPPPVPGPIYPYGYHPPRHEPCMIADPYEVSVVAQPQDPHVALLNVSVPADAEVWLQGNPTKQGGAQRVFQSPPLKDGQEYTYEIRARWKSEGHNVEVMKLLSIRAGDHLAVRLDAGATEPSLPMPRQLQVDTGR